MHKLILLGVCAGLLVACSGPAIPVPAAPPVVERPVTFTPEDSVFRVERVGLIDDEQSYGRKRAVYVLTDKETGIEYLGVSGIGMVERRKTAPDTTRTAHMRTEK